MGKRFALVMLLGLVVLTGCSTSEDISSMEISEVIVKVQTALNKLSKEEIHTQEKTTMTYPGGADTVVGIQMEIVCTSESRVTVLRQHDCSMEIRSTQKLRSMRTGHRRRKQNLSSRLV